MQRRANAALFIVLGVGALFVAGSAVAFGGSLTTNRDLSLTSAPTTTLPCTATPHTVAPVKGAVKGYARLVCQPERKSVFVKVALQLKPFCNSGTCNPPPPWIGWAQKSLRKASGFRHGANLRVSTPTVNCDHVKYRTKAKLNVGGTTVTRYSTVVVLC